MKPRRAKKAQIEAPSVAAVRAWDIDVGHDEEHGVDSATFYDNQDASQS